MLAIMFIGAQAISLGLPTAIVKYFPFLSKKTKKPKGLFLNFCIPIFLAFLAFSVVYLLIENAVLNLYDESTLMSTYYYYILPLILFSALFSILKSFISAQLDTVFASFLQEVLLRLVVIADLVLFYFNFISFNEFVTIFILNYGLQLLILAVYGFQKNYLEFSFSTDVVTKPIFSKISTFSMYSFLSGLTMMIVGNIDMIMLSALKGLAETGIYAIAFYVGSVISIPRKAVSKISLPLIAQSFEKREHLKISKVYKQTSLNQFLFGFLLFIGVWANIDNLYSILPKEYADGSIVILIIGAANLIDMVTGANSEIIVSSPFYRFGLYFSFFLVGLAILLNLIFIPIYGITGAALATAGSLFIYNFSKLIYVWKKLSIQPFSWEILGILIIGIFVLLLSFMVPALDNVYIDITIRSFLMATLYSALILVLNLSEEFKEAIQGLIAKVF